MNLINSSCIWNLFPPTWPPNLGHVNPKGLIANQEYSRLWACLVWKIARLEISSLSMAKSRQYFKNGRRKCFDLPSQEYNGKANVPQIVTSHLLTTYWYS